MTSDIESSAGRRSRLPVLRILHVEDDPSDALLIRTLLRGSREIGYEIHRVGTLASALDAAAAAPAAVLLDLDLPDSKGLATLARFREVHPKLPVVVVTGHLERELGLTALASGAHEYIVKDDASLNTLERRIRHAMERARVEEHLPRVGSRDGGLSVATSATADDRPHLAAQRRGRSSVVYVSLRTPYPERADALVREGIPVEALHIVDATGQPSDAAPRGLGYAKVAGPDALEDIAMAMEDGCRRCAPDCRVFVDDLDTILAANGAALTRDFLALLANRLHKIGVHGVIFSNDAARGTHFAAASPHLEWRDA